jgi:hypothetical protein
MKLSLCLSVFAQVLAPFALLALGACAAAPGDDGAATSDSLQTEAHHDGGTHHDPTGGSSSGTTSGGTSGGTSSGGTSGGTSSGGTSSGGTSGSSGTPGSCFALNGKADLRCTPGAFNPAVTQATIQTTICVRGWTDTIRPPVSYTEQMKNQQKPEYGEAAMANRDIEEDHLVPLELGGNPHDPNNLWPEPRDSVAPGAGAETKDQEESSLHDQVCRGQLTLDAARQKMLADWTH